MSGSTAGSLLSNRQKEELYRPPRSLRAHVGAFVAFILTIKCRHRAILSYLASSNLQSSYNALKNELAGFDGAGTDASKGANGEDDQRYKGLLEKKWTSVIRLQKKVAPTPKLCPSMNDRSNIR
jgi:hypothetical protein